MQALVRILLPLVFVAGCVAPRPGQFVQNPVQLPGRDRDFTWDQIVDVVDDYFEIEREDRVRLEGDVLTVGRIDTLPIAGATFFDPMRGDSANTYERLESTLQSIRRRALIQVVPNENGYLVDVAVYKELEDVPRPEFATAGAATLRHDSSRDRYTRPVGGQPTTLGWIPLGRDPALEQRILAKIQVRLGAAPAFQAPIFFGQKAPLRK